jgi:hypothetical protein
MEYDNEKIDDVVLAVLSLTAHRGHAGRPWAAWKNIDWDAMQRLHEKGYISNPVSKAKSVVFTEQGFEKAKNLGEKLFS